MPECLSSLSLVTFNSSFATSTKLDPGFENKTDSMKNNRQAKGMKEMESSQRRRRELNRLSKRRCRQRRIERLERLQKEVHQLSAEFKFLQTENAELRQELLMCLGHHQPTPGHSVQNETQVGASRPLFAASPGMRKDPPLMPNVAQPFLASQNPGHHLFLESRARGLASRARVSHGLIHEAAGSLGGPGARFGGSHECNLRSLREFQAANSEATGLNNTMLTALLGFDPMARHTHRLPSL